MRYVFILMVLLITACGTALPTVKPYKLDVQQGNVVTSKMLLQLRPGMTKSQVRFIMGTPLVQDSFHGNRWDYVYQLRESGKIKEQRRVILDFENELLKTVRGDVVPAGSDAAKPEDGENDIGTRVVKPAAKVEDKSLISKLKFWEKERPLPAPEATLKAKPVEANKPVAGPAESAKPIEKPMSAPIELAAPTSVGGVEVSKAEAEKSVLAMPIEAMPLAVAPTEVLSPAPVETSLAPVREPALDVNSAEGLQQAASPSTPLSVRRAYTSESGMLFDAQLKTAPDIIETPVEPLKTPPRNGNKTIPKPKDLPAENAPSFFDRMLEKIGF